MLRPRLHLHDQKADASLARRGASRCRARRHSTSFFTGRFRCRCVVSVSPRSGLLLCSRRPQDSNVELQLREPGENRKSNLDTHDRAAGYKCTAGHRSQIQSERTILCPLRFFCSAKHAGRVLEDRGLLASIRASARHPYRDTAIATYSEPSYLGFIVLCLVFVSQNVLKGRHGGGKMAFIAAAMATVLLAQTTSGIISIVIMLLFATRPSPRRRRGPYSPLFSSRLAPAS